MSKEKGKGKGIEINDDNYYDDETCILSLDTGTTNIRAMIFNKKLEVISRSIEEIPLIQEKPGWVEQDPLVLWEKCVSVIKSAIVSANIPPTAIKCMGIANQRSSFVTWNKHTGKPYHRFITWQDVRAGSICDSYNNGFIFKGIHGASTLAHFFTRKPRFLAASVIGVSTIQVPPRLLWVLENVEGAKEACKSGDLIFGTTDTWLVWNLTGRKVHATDYSNFSSTGLFDPYIFSINRVVVNIMKIPINIFPEIYDTAGSFGECEENIFGHAIPITAVCGDQQAALFGQCCFDQGNIKITLGTGCFVDILTGSKPQASAHGMYPLVAWKIGDKCCFALEGSSSTCGTVVDWAKSIGLYHDVKELSDLACTVKDTAGMVFVPAFSGLSSPHNDPSARGMLIGMTSHATKAHIMRSILESFGYRCKELIDTIRKDSLTEKLNFVCVDGGVSRNDFVVQFISDMADVPINRSSHPDMTAVGACMLSGMGKGIWKNYEELKQLRKTDRTFQPNMQDERRDRLFSRWGKAVNLSMHWADDDEIHEKIEVEADLE